MRTQISSVFRADTGSQCQPHPWLEVMIFARSKTSTVPGYILIESIKLTYILELVHCLSIDIALLLVLSSVPAQPVVQEILIGRNRSRARCIYASIQSQKRSCTGPDEQRGLSRLTKTHENVTNLNYQKPFPDS